MIKGITLYPKTKRIGLTPKIIITEKLDGSNLGFFKVGENLLIAQRNNIIYLSEIDEQKDALYKGLYGWLKEHGQDLYEKLIDGSGVFGEWIGMGKLKYPNLDKRFYIFAKGNVDEHMNIKNIINDRKRLIYPFVDATIPNYIDLVPLVDVPSSYTLLDITKLDELYEQYTNQVNRNVEGFVIYLSGSGVVKYVRMKNGKIEPHFEREGNE